MVPLQALYEARDVPPSALPAPLERLYGGSLGLAAPTVYANFVSSLDGTVALPAVPRSNRVISAGSEADRYVMGVLRALSDAILIGAGTLAASPTGTWYPERAHPGSAALLAELRRELGRPERPELVVVSGSGEIDADHPALRGSTVVFTTRQGASRLRVPSSTEVVVLAEEGAIAAPSLIAAARDRGHDLILVEAGPHTFGRLATAGLVDELFLTVSPLLTGGSHEPRLSLFEGVDPSRDGIVSAELLTVRRHAEHLFLRYRLNRPETAISDA